MQVKELKNEGLELEYLVTIPFAKLEEAASAKLMKVAKTVKIDGFRPGKVPMKIVEQRYKSAVLREALEDKVESEVSSLIREKNLKLASQARVDDLKFEDGKDVEFKVILEKMPEIKEFDFSKIKIEKPVVKISDKEVLEKIEKLAESRTNFKIAAKTTKAKEGDKVMIDFEGFLNGEVFEGGKGENFGLVLGSKTFIPGFEDQLIGSKAGDDVTVKVKFPEEYGAKDLAGKGTEFKVKVHEVHKPEPVEINDELAVQFGAKDLEDLKSNMKSSIEKSFEGASIEHQKMKLFDALENSLDFDAPASLVKREEELMLEQLQQYKDSDPELKKMNDKELAEYAAKVSLRRVKIGLMLADYADKNDIRPDSNDFRAAIMAQARSFPGREMEVFEFYQKNPRAAQSLSGPIIEDKSVRHILENKVKLNEKEYTVDKFNKLMEELEK